MKGLLLNNIYSSIDNIRLFAVIVVAVAVGLLVTGNPTAQELFVYIAITAFSINAVASARKDAVSNWSRFELTMPVDRKNIVTSKYLAYVFWVLVGTVFALAVTFAALLIHESSNLTYGVNSLYSMFALGIGIALLTGALFYPLSYLVGIDKSETILIISVLLAIGIAIVTLNVLNHVTSAFALRMAAFIAFYIMVFAGSYRLVCRIYMDKEF